MDKATDAKGPEAGGAKGGRSTQRRGSQLDKLTIGATVVVTAKAPTGSRHKGYKDIVVQDLSLKPTVTRYRRERRETPDGRMILGELDRGIVGGYGPHLHRLVLALHFSGQVTCERIVALLNGMGVAISKRQVVRLLTAKLETFRAEDEAVLKAGLSGADVTVDDTGARHAGKSGYKLAPNLEQAQILRARFDRIFKRARTGYARLDSLLKRLHRHKDEVLRVLERPEIPLGANASENDIRAFVTKRKISGGTVSEKGRDARDVMLGLAKTCMTLELSFYDFIGDRLATPGPKIPHLANLVRHDHA